LLPNCIAQKASVTSRASEALVPKEMYKSELKKHCQLYGTKGMEPNRPARRRKPLILNQAVSGKSGLAIRTGRQSQNLMDLRRKLLDHDQRRGEPARILEA
jgi:hypothetical protein